VSDKASSRLELDGTIYLVHFDAEGKEVDRKALDGQVMIDVCTAILDDAIQNPLLDKLLTPMTVDEETP